MTQLSEVHLIMFSTKAFAIRLTLLSFSLNQFINPIIAPPPVEDVETVKDLVNAMDVTQEVKVKQSTEKMSNLDSHLCRRFLSGCDDHPGSSSNHELEIPTPSHPEEMLSVSPEISKSSSIRKVMGSLGKVLSHQRQRTIRIARDDWNLGESS